MLWSASVTAAVEDALSRARSGQPGMLVVLGDAGFGKSSLLADLRRRAHDFVVVGGTAIEADREPLSTAARLGLTLDRTPDDRPPDTVTAAAGLQRMLDDLGSGPILLWVDDHHWADPESTAALRLLFERADGHALVVVVATRPPGSPELREWMARTPAVVPIELTGLGFAAAAELVRDLRPGLDPTAVRALLEHTGGNPLYFRTLLTERDDLELHRGRVLPAPTAFARAVVARLQRCGGPAEALLRAVSVLGAAGWVSLYDAAEVMGHDDDGDSSDDGGDGGRAVDPDAAAQTLLQAGLVVHREVDGIAQVMPAHSLVRSAVYQSIPLPRLRLLHLRAAQVVDRPDLALEHRASAVSRYDDEVAMALARSGWGSYRRGSARLGARHLRWAGSLTRDPELREQRRLDAVFVGVMGRDVAVRARDIATVGRAQDGPRQAAVLGLQALLTGAPDDAAAILEPAVARWPVLAEDPPVDGDDGEPGEAAVRYRLATLLAWARVGDGNSLDFLDQLARAAAHGVVDAPLIEVIGFAQGLARVRSTGAEMELDRLAGLPRDPAVLPPEMTFVLGWRGLLSMVLGLFDDALADQQEVLHRVRGGVAADTSAGGIRPYLATALWSVGQWDLARVQLRTAVDTGAAQAVGPLLALFALEPAGRGRVEAADEWIARAVASSEHWNWPEIPQNLLMARVVRWRTVGTPEERAAVWPDMVRRFPVAMAGRGLTGVPWLIYATLAAVWARDLTRAREFLERTRTGSPRPIWTPTVAQWLSGLVAEVEGDAVTALAYCEQAVAQPERPPLMHRLWMVHDVLRLRSAAGRTAGPAGPSADLLRVKSGLHHELGVPSHLFPVDGAVGVAATAEGSGAGFPPGPSGGASDARDGSGGYGLSDREADVATLVAAGLSYQQIARELLITRSTVGFHLGNIYAKAGVSTRHELTALMRREPVAFGLSPSRPS